MLNYIIYMLPAFILSMIAQLYVTSAYRKWSQVRNYHNLTGIERPNSLPCASVYLISSSNVHRAI